MPKQIQLCLLETACTGSYMASGQWRSPTDKGKTNDRIKYWTDLAKLAEKGKLSAIFIADLYVGFDVYGGSIHACLKAGHQVAHLDPTPLILAMAAATSSIAFAATAPGFDQIPPHDERYVMAEEYMDVVYKLWESSWADDSVVWAEDMAFDPEKVKKMEHKGKYFSAGTSKSGTAFAAKHAEAISMNPATPKLCKQQIDAARAEAKAQGRDPSTLKFFPYIVPTIGRTEEEARAKYAKVKSYGDMIGGLAQFSGYTGIDMSLFPLDEPFTASNIKGGAAIQAVLSSFEASVDGTEPWTPRRLGERMALGGTHPSPVGSAEQVADFLENWVNETDCDGFNVAYVSNPGSLEDIVEFLVPKFQRRGIYWNDYAKPEGTFREDLLGHRYLAEDHYGAKFKYGRDPGVLNNVQTEVNGAEKPKVNGAAPVTQSAEAVV